MHVQPGDLAANEIVIPEVFSIPEGTDIKAAVVEVLDRQGSAHQRIEATRALQERTKAEH